MTAIDIPALDRQNRARRALLSKEVGRSPRLDPSRFRRPTDIEAMTRDEIDAKIAASEARNEAILERAMGEVRTEFAALRGDIRTLTASSASKGTVIATGVTLFFGIAGILAAFLSFGSQWFGLGLDSGQVAQQAADRVLSTYASAPLPQQPSGGTDR